MILRCYTSKDDDVHIACCLDLCLCAQEDSVEKVKTKLRCMIDEYVEEAYTVDKKYLSQLIPRYAPLGEWIRYYFYRFVRSKKVYYEIVNKEG
jgi:ribonucleotide reductase beta subunit family protein with ferritin-like domain